MVTAPDIEAPSPVWRRLLVPLAVLAATALVYWRALAGEPVYDDTLIVARNPYIADLSNLRRVLFSGYWDFLGMQDADNIGYWRPLTALSQALIWRGFDYSPVAFHAFCLAIHLLATAVAFGFARLLSGSAWVAGAAALVFGLHPVHVESVAWISSLNDPLFGLFALASMTSYLRWRQGGSLGFPLLAAVLFGVSLGAKELAAATLPMLVAIDLGRRREPGEAPGLLGGLRAPVRAWAPFAVALGLYLGARMLVFESPWAGFDRQTTDFAVGTGRLAALRVEILGGSADVLAWPRELNLFRRFRPYLAYDDPVFLRPLAAMVVLLVATLVAWRKRAGTALTALLLLPAGLLPVLLKVESLGRFPLSERFLYVPVLGFGLVLALLLRRLLPRSLATLAVLVLGGLYGWRSHDRIGVWRNEETLFRDAVERSPRSVYAWWGLGRVLLDRTNDTDDPRFLADAFVAHENAQQLLLESKRPNTDLFVSPRDYVSVTLGLAWCYLHEARLDPGGNYGTSITLLEDLAQRIGTAEQRKLELEREGVEVEGDYLDLEKVYTALGVAHRFAGDSEAAEAALKKALLLQPRYPEAHQNLGRVYFDRGELLPARRHFEQALEQRPANFEDRLLLAQCLHEEGQTARAEELALELIEDNPGFAQPYVIVAANRLARGNADGALAWLERALAADRSWGHAWYLKGMALLQKDARQEAITPLRNAARLLPDNFAAQYNLGSLLYTSGALEEGLPYLVRAYAVGSAAQVPNLRRELDVSELVTKEQYLQLGLADGRRGELDLAETWLNRALARDARFAQALYEKSRLLRRRDRDDEALVALRAAVAERPESFTLVSELGVFEAQLELWESAEASLERALTLEPPGDWAPEARARAKDPLRELLVRVRARDLSPPPTDG